MQTAGCTASEVSTLRCGGLTRPVGIISRVAQSPILCGIEHPKSSGPWRCQIGPASNAPRKKRVCQCCILKLLSAPHMTAWPAMSPVQDREALTAALQQAGAEVPQLASAAVAGGSAGGGDPTGAYPVPAAGSAGTHAAVAELREQLVSPCRNLFASLARESERSTLLICCLQAGRLQTLPADGLAEVCMAKDCKPGSGSRPLSLV